MLAGSAFDRCKWFRCIGLNRHATRCPVPQRSARRATRSACLADGRTALSQHRRRAPAKRRTRRRTSVLLITSVTAALAITAGVYTAVLRSGGGADPTAAVVAEIPEQPRGRRARAGAPADDPDGRRVADSQPGQHSQAGDQAVAGPSPAPSPDPAAASVPVAQARWWSACRRPIRGVRSRSRTTCCHRSAGRPAPSTVAWTTCGTARAAGVTTPRTRAAPTGSRRPCLAPRWRPPGADWETDPATQIKWGLGYIQGRYGSPCAAWSFWQANGWY